MNDGFSVDNRSGDELKRLLKKHSINHNDLARVIGIDRSLMHRWITNKTRMNKFLWLVLLIMCNEAIVEDVFDIVEQ